jgi:hypothetical protein
MQMVPSRLSGRELTLAFLIALATITLVSIPYALGYALARPGQEFTGVIMNPEDSQSYFAKMLQGYNGSWLYTIPFTTEAHSPEFVGGFYLALGHVARGLGLSLVEVWHLSRMIADLLMFMAVFGFVATFLHDVRTRWIAYLLAIFGSGLGWLLLLLNQPDWLDWFPVDFKMPEAHLFFSALAFPHVALGTALIVASFWLSMRGFAATGNWLYSLCAGFVNLALAIVYPFLIYLIVVTLGLYWVYRVARGRQVLWREALRFAAAFALPAPLIAYYAITLATNPIFRAWDAQSITLSPPLPHYFLAYGVLLALALLSLRRARAEHAILWAWLVAVALLVYAPLNPQRRFVEGVQVPLAILATIGFAEVVLPWLGQTRIFRALSELPRYSTAGLEGFLVATFLILSSLSNLYVLASLSVVAVVEQPYPLFRSNDEMGAIDWLSANTARSDVVVGAYETGNYVAASAGNRVVIGHWAETVDWDRKLNEVDAFYDTVGVDASHLAFLQRYGVRYVWYGVRERELGKFDPASAAYLESAFANGTVRIYRVINQ